MAIKLSPLPWAEDALEPHITARTIGYHYGKHHRGYVDKVNAALDNGKDDLESLILQADGSLFNNAAQVWNHSFYWSSLAPDSDGPDGVLKDALTSRFGSIQKFKDELAEVAKGEFGSGWAWLVLDSGKLEIISTTDAENPMRDGKTPLVNIDVWEHAYYLDYQNDRGKYVTAVLDHLLNWTFIERNYTKVTNNA